MDAVDKIVVFDNFNALKDAIDADLESKEILSQRYCVRFIMLNNFEVFRNLTKFLNKDRGVELLDLENHTFGEDKTLTIDSLCDLVKGVTKTTLVTPFSELVRFYQESDFNGFFNDIILTESISDPHKRIYIPIIGLHNRFMDFLKNFGRIEESAPIWQYYTEKDDKVVVYISRFSSNKLPADHNFCVLRTMRQWLKFWKQQAPKEKILCNAAPIIKGFVNAKPDSIFTFPPIDSAFDFIRDFLEINVPIEHKPSEDCYWEELLEAINVSNAQVFSLKRFVLEYFNKKSIDVNDIISLWAEESTSSFGRWLLRNFALSNDFFKDNQYIRTCLEETTKNDIPNALFEKISERIFFSINPAEIENSYLSRRNIMLAESKLFRSLVSSETQNWIRDKIIEIAQKENGISLAKKFCTGVFSFERELFLGWYNKRSDSEFGDEHIKYFYPDIYHYLHTNLDNVIVRKSWVNDYFVSFREAKLSDSYTDSIKNAISTYNQDENCFYDWYHAFSESHQLLQSIKNDDQKSPDKVYWIDGLGAEYLPYILHIIKQEQVGYSVIHAEYARTTIPSNTHLNAFEVDNKVCFKISDLDELAHGSNYIKYSTIIQELDTIHQIIRGILNDNKVGNHTIAIVSDHGLSFLSRLCSSKKFEGKIKHEGRYLQLEDDSVAKSETDYVVHENETDHKKYKVALTHSSLGHKPTHEVHGGCTPEEVLVPFIVITNNESSKPIEYNVQIESEAIAVSDGTLSFIINPEPKYAHIYIDGVKYKLEYNNLRWSLKVPGLSEGKHLVTVVPFKGEPHSFSVNLYGLGFSGGTNDFDFE